MKKTTIQLAILLFMFAFGTKAQTTNYKTYSIFLYSFSKYVEWPDDARNGDFIIAVMGSSKLTAELQADLGVKKVGDRHVKIIEAKVMTDLDGAHLIFVPDVKSGSVDEIVATFKGKPTLIVTERDGLVKKGACVSFIKTEDNLLKFELNETDIKERRLKIASALSNLAVRRI